MDEKKPDPVLPRIAAGEPGATEECIERYKGLVWWLARQMAGSDAEDAVQEIFIELWTKADRYDPSKSSEPAFVAMITRRRLIDRRRRIGRRPPIDSLDNEEREIVVRAPQGVEANAEVALAARAINTLKPKEREVLVLSLYHGMSHSEIANKTSMPLGTVKTYVRRGLQRVRERLTAQPGLTQEAAT
ncbi:MAG: sigma-70 family RNA polymerase sigma factor [Acidobacteriota bacterium]